MSKVVLGGGLSGLSATYYMLRNLKNISPEALTVIESSNRVGGWISSNRQENGIIFEQGPRTIRPGGPAGQNTLELLEQLHVSDKIVPIPSSHPAAQNRMIYAKGSLHKLPSSILSLFKKQEPFTKPLISHLLNDMRAPAKLSLDESIYDFISRRFGFEVADYLISPLICGICAGNAKEISVNFLMEKYYVYEQEFGSISRGIFHNLLLKDKSAKEYKNNLHVRAKREKWNVYSFTDGCETLPKALESSIRGQGVNISLNMFCKELLFDPKGQVKLVLSNNETKIADHVISSVPAQALGNLVARQHPKLAQMLKKIKNVSVAVVNLYFNKRLIQEEGFGLLVAPKEKLPILGVIYDSCCFPKDNSSTVLTVMMGGYWFEEYFGGNPEEQVFLYTALEQLKNILNIHEKPDKFKINVLRDCLPQYVVGHKQNLRYIREYIKNNKLPLSLCGSSYDGVGVNDVILSAKKVVEVL